MPGPRPSLNRKRKTALEPRRPNLLAHTATPAEHKEATSKGRARPKIQTGPRRPLWPFEVAGQCG
eukprot:1763981-Alexandrium_andersonii.AAC.1